MPSRWVSCSSPSESRCDAGPRTSTRSVTDRGRRPRRAVPDFAESPRDARRDRAIELRLMAKTSAGLLLFRERSGALEVFLVHPGGPFWASKDEGAWSIPKGELGDGEDPLAAAKRELEEEVGAVELGELFALEPVRQSGGKVVHAWAARAEFDPGSLASNTFTIEWPPRSGHMRAFPEVDRAAWLAVDEARRKILRAQEPLI